MADDNPADLDPDEDRVREWNQARATEVAPPVEEILADAIPEAVETNTPRPDVTGRHNTLTPAEFASAIDLTDRDAFARGVAHGDAAGYARGIADGRADVQSGDWAGGVEDALAALRVYLFSEGIVHVEDFSDKVRQRVKRSS